MLRFGSEHRGGRQVLEAYLHLPWSSLPLPTMHSTDKSTSAPHRHFNQYLNPSVLKQTLAVEGIVPELTGCGVPLPSPEALTAMVRAS